MGVSLLAEAQAVIIELREIQFLSVEEAKMADKGKWFRCTAALLTILCMLATDPVQGQGIEAARTEFQAELRRLAGVCDRVGLTEEAAITRTWLPPERDDRFTLYLPSPNISLSMQTDAAKHWLRYFTQAREQYAAALFAEAKRAVAEDEAKAYRLLWQVLREDPTHSGANAALGNMVAVVRASPHVRSGGAVINDLGWQPRSYLSVRSVHFDLVSRGSRQQTERLAAKLEKLFVLWTQVFYSCWAEEGKLATAFDKPTMPRLTWSHKGRFKVAMLADRTEYIDLLGASEEAIGVSVGYYQPLKKIAIFYGGDQLDVTLVHELTHQFFAESSTGNAGTHAGARDSYWLVEGVAMYMESLVDQGAYWTLGGWESSRVQTARYRGVRDGYWLPLERLSSSTIDAWKGDPQISLLYTHAAGITHSLLDNRLPAATQRQTVKALRELYNGSGNTVGLLGLLGPDDEAAKIAYQDSLIVSDEDVTNLAKSSSPPTDLVLSGSQLQTTSWQQLAKNNAVRWLDLAYSNVSSEVLAQWIGQADELRRLSLEGTGVNAATMAKVRDLPKLEELDLSDTSVTDTDLEALHSHPTLQTLWLTRTQVTDAALRVLQTIPRLKTVDATGTNASDAQWEAWRQ